MVNDADKSPTLIGVGSLFIDDIVKPDGTSHMGVLGGAVIHALMGAAIWEERAGLCAVCGEGLPASARQFIREHLDLTGLTILPIPQVRAWQIFEHDGRRRELHRVDIVAPFVEGAQPNHLPDVYKNAKAYYLLQDFESILRWRDHVSGLLLWEPNQLVMIPENRQKFRETLRTGAIDIVSPNLLEAQIIYGDLPPQQLISAMLKDGATTVALRMGSNGSIVANEQELHQIPAYTTNLVDPTGAGNTYCGALLTGLMRGKSLMQAGIMGTVSASFCVETIGVVDPAKVDPQARDERVKHIQSLIF
ncbi:MAG: PfkB family carbohydrate kinase [Aggregatilineales bacterium]